MAKQTDSKPTDKPATANGNGKAGRPARDPNEPADRYFARRASEWLGRLTRAADVLTRLPGSTPEQRAKVAGEAEKAAAKLRAWAEKPDSAKQTAVDFGL